MDPDHTALSPDRFGRRPLQATPADLEEHHVYILSLRIRYLVLALYLYAFCTWFLTVAESGVDKSTALSSSWGWIMNRAATAANRTYELSANARGVEVKVWD